MAEGRAQDKFEPLRKIYLASQRNIAIDGLLEFPVHFKIVHYILPAVTVTDIPDRAACEPRRGSKDHMLAVTRDMEERPALQICPPRRSVPAKTVHVPATPHIAT